MSIMRVLRSQYIIHVLYDLEKETVHSSANIKWTIFYIFFFLGHYTSPV